MAEPQPPSTTAGSAAADEPENPTLKAGSKDDAKAAAALSSLDARGEDGDASKPAGDSAALAGAMKDLKVDGSSEAKTTAPPKKVKIDAKDVTLIVEQCDINKVRATELLRSNEGDLMQALSAYVDGKA